MEVLLTNDDGFDSPGILALAHAFAGAGHRVTIVAPDGNRSAASHALTLFTPLVARSASLDGDRIVSHAVNGTPADCAKLALNELMRERQPDLVVSGINIGANLGTNVFYSGTIGGAFEGALAGLPAFAVSVVGAEEAGAPTQECDVPPLVQADPTRHLEGIAAITVRLITRLMRDGSGESRRDHLLVTNLNFPAGPPAEIRGVRIAPQGRAAFADAYERRVDPRQRPYYWLSGVQGYVFPAEYHRGADDLAAVTAGYIALTPLRFDLNCPGALERLSAAAAELSQVVRADDASPGARG